MRRPIFGYIWHIVSRYLLPSVVVFYAFVLLNAYEVITHLPTVSQCAVWVIVCRISFIEYVVKKTFLGK